MLSKTRRDRIQNDIVRISLSTNPLNRIAECLQKRVLEARPIDTRTRGRKRVFWQDTINKSLTEQSIQARTAQKMAQDRLKWRGSKEHPLFEVEKALK